MKYFKRLSFSPAILLLVCTIIVTAISNHASAASTASAMLRTEQKILMASLTAQKMKRSPSRGRTTTTSCPTCDIATKTSDASRKDADAKSSSTESSTLTFKGDCTFTSEPCPVTKRGELIHFFNQHETMKLLLSAGGKRPCQTIPITSEIRQLWKQSQSRHKYNNDGGDLLCVMATDTDAQFPGFKLITTVLNGCKRRYDPRTGLPIYEFCMIGDRKRIVGSPPVVWLVRKLTGLSKDDDTTNQKFQLSETRAKSVISMIEQQSKSSNSCYAFQLDVEFTTSVKFPKLLLKMLPASKSKVEERGTQSVQKAIMKDASSAVEVVREIWIKKMEMNE